MERSVALVPIAVLRTCGLERAKLRTGQRHLTDVARPGAGKFPARNGLAEQQVRHRLTTARAGGPDHHPGLRLDAFELGRPPGHHRRHERRAGGEHRFEQALLAAGQIETGLRDVLADHDLRFAEHRHDNIGGTRADRCRARKDSAGGPSTAIAPVSRPSGNSPLVAQERHRALGGIAQIGREVMRGGSSRGNTRGRTGRSIDGPG